MTFKEDTSYVFSANTFPLDNLVSVKITQLPSKGTLTLNGNAVNLNDTITVANLPSLVFTPAANQSGDPYTTLKYQPTDNTGLLPTIGTLTFNVVPVYDAPTTANKTITVVSDSSYTFAAADFAFSSVEVGAKLVGVVIKSLPAVGTLKLNGNPFVVGQTIVLADLAKLTFTPVAGASGSPYTTFQFAVFDGQLNSLPATITVNVVKNLPGNSIPTTANKSVTIVQGASYTFTATTFPFTDTDVADKLTSVKITVLPTKGTLKLAGVAVALNAIIPVASLGTLVFTPVATESGQNYTTLQFQVSDGKVFSTSATLTFNVTPANNAPTTTNSAVTVKTGTPFTFAAANFPFSDTNLGDTLKTVKITSLPAKGSLKLNGFAFAAGTAIAVADLTKLVYTPGTGSGAPYTTFQFQVGDGLAYSSAATLTINIFPPPTASNNTVSTAYNTLHTFGVSEFPFAPTAPGRTLQSIKIMDLPSSGDFFLGGVKVGIGQVITAADLINRKLTYRPPINVRGSTAFGFQVSEDGASYSNTAIMTIRFG